MKTQEAKTAEESKKVVSLFENLGNYQGSRMQCESHIP